MKLIPALLKKIKNRKTLGLFLNYKDGSKNLKLQTNIKQPKIGKITEMEILNFFLQIMEPIADFLKLSLMKFMKLKRKTTFICQSFSKLNLKKD